MQYCLWIQVSVISWLLWVPALLISLMMQSYSSLCAWVRSQDINHFDLKYTISYLCAEFKCSTWLASDKILSRVNEVIHSPTCISHRQRAAVLLWCQHMDSELMTNVIHKKLSYGHFKFANQNSYLARLALTNSHESSHVYCCQLIHEIKNASLTCLCHSARRIIR